MPVHNITTCPLQLNGDGRWQCPDCNWVCKHQTARPPVRNCPNSPDLNTPEYRERIKAKILAELEPLDIPNDLATIAEQLDRCMVCEQFSGRTCTYRGAGCTMRTRWLELLALMTAPCRKFAEKPSVD